MAGAATRQRVFVEGNRCDLSALSGESPERSTLLSSFFRGTKIEKRNGIKRSFSLFINFLYSNHPSESITSLLLDACFQETYPLGQRTECESLSGVEHIHEAINVITSQSAFPFPSLSLDLRKYAFYYHSRSANWNGFFFLHSEISD